MARSAGPVSSELGGRVWGPIAGGASCARDLRSAARDPLCSPPAPSYRPLRSGATGFKRTAQRALEHLVAEANSTLNRHADRGFDVDQTTRTEALARAEERQGFTYTPEQKAAVDRLTRDEGIGVMVGIAGAGKSTVMAAVNEIYTAAGAGVYGAALAGKAADNLQQSSGIESLTLASWENAWAGGYNQLSRGDVFVIDEAGMVASAQMARVMAQLDSFGAKVLLVGDARQLQPIEAGAAFRSIASEVGYVELTEVRRQEREDHARASVLFGAGEARSAMDIYKGNDTFQFHDARAGALEAAIKGWDHDRRAGADVVILAHTNRDVLDLNAMARASIKLDGGLTGGETFATARGPREFAPGDRVLFLENDRTLGVRNGSIGHVESVGSKGLVVSLPDRAEPVSITREGYNNIDHGYATTIHKSQGSTYDRVHVVAGAMMDAQLSYVSLSRHREDVTFHIPLDVFTRPGAEQLATPDQAMNRLSRETLKDTSIDFRQTPDYAEAKEAMDARIALAASPAGRFETFLEQRGLPHPSEVLEQVKAYAASFLAQNGPQDASQQIRVDPPAHYRDATQAASLEPHDDLRQSLNRLQHVQDHSASMNHEGSARRSAFHTAENELTRYATSQHLRDYAERVADVLAPSLVVAIGPNLADPDHEPRLAGLSQPVRDALGANWRDVHAVSRATWELGLLETVRDIDTTYRQQREDQRVLADYERMVSPAPASPPAPVAVELPAMADRSPSVQPSEPERAVPLLNLPVLPSISVWSQSVDQAVAVALPKDPDVEISRSSALAEASRIWRNPAEALGQIRSEIAADPGRLNDVLKAVAREPQSYGDLLGGRTVFLQPDAERKEALTRIPIVSSTISQLVGLEQRTVPFLAKQEREWRAHMATPAPSLSPEALGALSTLAAAHDLKQTDREAGHHMAASTLSNPKALEEIKSWRQDAEKRLSVPDALERLPDMTPEKREEVRSIVATIDQAVKTSDMSQSVERSRDRERDAAKNPDRDLGMGM